MSNPRGDTQARILAYIEKATLQKGYPPSVREICDATGLKSTSTVHGHLIRLEKKRLAIPGFHEAAGNFRAGGPSDVPHGDGQRAHLGPCNSRRAHSGNRKY